MNKWLNNNTVRTELCSGCEVKIYFLEWTIERIKMRNSFEQRKMVELGSSPVCLFRR